MIKIPLRHRISFKLAQTGIILALIIGLTFSGFQVYRNFKYEEEKLNAGVGNFLTSLASAASRSIHILDIDLASEVVDGLLNNKFIQSATVVDDFGIVLSHRTKPKQGTRSRWISNKIIDEYRTYTVPLPMINSKSSLHGQLIVVINNNWAFASFFERSFFILLVDLIRNMILVLLLFIAFYLQLTKPIVKLTELINSIDPEDLDSNGITVAKQHRNDELGLLANTTNNFIALIQQLLVERKKNEVELIIARDELEIRVGERTEELEREVLEREYVQNKLKDANANLEQRVDERTKELKAEITERKRDKIELIKAKEAAESSSRIKSEFLANMSHELRTPLNAIIGFSSIMQDELFGKMNNKKYIEYSGDINSSGTHLLEVIGDILDVSKIEVGELILAESSFSLYKLMEACLKTLNVAAENRGLVMHNNISTDFPDILADQLRIRQVFLNILTNAVKFTNNGGTVTIIAYLDACNNIIISITDTGIGIPEDKIEYVLEPFSQVDNVFSRTHDGVGLGLSLTKSLIELHNGEIRIESEVDIGTSIIIIMPAERTILNTIIS